MGSELTSCLGVPRRARRLASSPRSRVWRVELPGGPAVVKQVLDAGGDAVSRFRREVTALRFVAGVSPQVVPALLGVDEAERVMVLEYLPAGRSSEDRKSTRLNSSHL